jgi:hypothetical protein
MPVPAGHHKQAPPRVVRDKGVALKAEVVVPGARDKAVALKAEAVVPAALAWAATHKEAVQVPAAPV